jgi:TPR repeat protein
MNKRVSWMAVFGFVCAAASPAMAAMSQAQGETLVQAVQTGDHGALATLRQAAQQGDAVAQDEMGVLYNKGQGVQQDYAEAARWYREAAEQGYPQAQVHLGMLYSDGRGVKRDYQQAEQWLLKAADQGNANGMTSLGILYELGLGVQRNRVVAYALYELAIAHGAHKDAVFYRHRLGVYINRAARAKAKTLMQQMQKAKNVSTVLKQPA